jgi:L-fucose isomerase-like protein
MCCNPYALVPELESLHGLVKFETINKIRGRSSCQEVMMNWKQVTLGLCPIGKFVFSHEDACRQKAALVMLLREWQVKFVDLERVLPDGMVRDQKQVEPVVEHFRGRKIDALFMPHCNFGTEGAAGMIGRRLGVPVLLWGPRDEAPLPDGTRLRDSLCGLFASSKVLHKLDVPFTYIENCRMEDSALQTGVIDFLRAASVVKAFKSLRIGMVGGRIDFFWTTKVNESELLERFGIEIVPIDLVRVLKRVKDYVRGRSNEYARELAELKKVFRFTGYPSDEPIINQLALRDFFLEWAREENLSVITEESFTSLSDELGGYAAISNSLACEAGLPIITESDIHGAVGTVMLESAQLDWRPSFFADLTIRHPTDDNGILLWHGYSPAVLAGVERPLDIGVHWILPGAQSGMGHWRLRDGDLTIARFDGDGGDYSLIAGEGRTISGPRTQNSYAWMAVNDWPRWERAFIEGPYIHHVSAAYDRSAGVLFEACKYIPGLRPDRSLA